MGLFLLGILFDEGMRRWIIPWIRRGRDRGYLLGRLCGSYFKPATTDGMSYMSGADVSFTDRLKEEAARALVDSFAQELMSGSLGAVDEQCRAALHRHLALHKRRADMMGWGFHNPFRRSHSSAPQLPAPPLPGPTPMNPDGDAPPPPDGGGDAGVVAGMMGISLPMFRAMTSHHGRHGHHPHHLKRRRHAVMGWGLSSLNPFASSPGRLLVSAVPGGVAATEAHDIARRSIKNGTLNPDHLRKAGDLARRGRHGDQAALVKIAHIKHHAGRGNPHAEVAMDRLKLAHSMQTGHRVTPSRHSGAMRRHYAAGAELMQLHPHRAT